MENELFRAFELSELISDLSPPNRKKLFSFFEVLEGESGDVLFTKGDPSDGLYIVVNGVCDVELEGSDDKPKAIMSIGASKVFGELSLIMKSNRRVQVRATAKTALLALTRQRFRDVKREAPEAGLQLVMAITKRLAKTLNDSADAIERVIQVST